MPGGYQLILIALLAVLLFGRGKISGMMEDVALGIKSFKKGMADDDETDIAKKDQGTVIDHDAEEKVGSAAREKAKTDA